jgi:hypothetical protein
LVNLITENKSSEFNDIYFLRGKLKLMTRRGDWTRLMNIITQFLRSRKKGFD